MVSRETTFIFILVYIAHLFELHSVGLGFLFLKLIIVVIIRYYLSSVSYQDHSICTLGDSFLEKCINSISRQLNIFCTRNLSNEGVTRNLD